MSKNQDVTKEEMKIFDDIFKKDPMFFMRVPSTLKYPCGSSYCRINCYGCPFRGDYKGREEMEITVVDVWLNKIKKYGWKIEDIPKKYRELRKELRRRLKENGSQSRKSAPGIDS